MSTEIVLMWSAVTLYAFGAIIFIIGTVFRKEKLFSVGLGVSLLGLLPHVIAITLRWIAVGHGPFLGFYEVVSSYAFFSVIALGILSFWKPTLRVLGVVIMPVAFLLLGGAMLASKSPLVITAQLASWWLTIHVIFAKLAYTSFVAAFALSVIFLLREKKSGKQGSFLSKLPAQSVLDDVSFRLIGVGFIFWSIMIVAGAIWANESWGRYWSWDPIETWSLITWLVYAVYLHTRLTLGWRGRKSAIFAVSSLFLMVFTLIGVPLVFNSIHAAYMTGK